MFKYTYVPYLKIQLITLTFFSVMLPVTDTVLLFSLGLQYLLLFGCELQLPFLSLPLQLFLLLLQHHDLLLVTVHFVGLLDIFRVEMIFKCSTKDQQSTNILDLLV